MHLAVDAGTTDVEPEGDETILCQDKPIGNDVAVAVVVDNGNVDVVANFDKILRF